MARIEAGKLHLDKRRWPVEQIVTGALAELDGLRKGRAVTVHVAADLPRGRGRSRVGAAGGEAVSGERAQVFARGLAASPSRRS